SPTGARRTLPSFPTRRSSDLTATLEKQAVAHLHDIRLVDGGHFLAAFAPRVLEGRPRDSHRRMMRDDLQALHHAGHYLVLQARVDRKSTRLNSSHVAISYAVF